MYASDRIAPTSYLSRMFSIVQYGDLRFLILDCPTESTLPAVLKILQKEHVTDVVRVCEPTYATDSLNAAGITVHDMSFRDGGVPPSAVLHKFMALVEQRAAVAAAAAGNGHASPSAAADASPRASPRSRPASLASASSTELNGDADSAVPAVPSNLPPPTIAVHCVAGLGRAPVLIAVALIEHGMSPLDAIEYVRARRRGAFNTTQVKYLDGYKPHLRAAHSHASGSGGSGSGRGSPLLRGLTPTMFLSSSSSSGSTASGRRSTSSPDGGAETTTNQANAAATGAGAQWGDSIRQKFGRMISGLKRKGTPSPPSSVTVTPRASSNSLANAKGANGSASATASTPAMAATAEP
ncbi:Protein tyrosine phosphatase type IVA 2 [Blastocladiella emersonii ATCC 22665]|nr:Protein tyrosine phosphatase type IVA 2 [Blastocladiella emersonii ATCC 22665]